MTRDLRDPQALGKDLLAIARSARETYELPREQATLSQVYDLLGQHLDVPDYVGGGLMSNDPAKHHSRTPQREGDLGE